MMNEIETTLPEIITEPTTEQDVPKSPFTHVVLDYLSTVFFMILYFFKGLFRF